MTADPSIGRLLSNRYQLTELLGKGAMGRVYGAKDMLLGGVPVAIKFLAHALLNQKMLDRFEREAKTCALLGQRSMHIVRVTDYGVDEDEVPYYVMEYLKGETLSELIGHQNLTLPRFLSLTRQMCLGLQCAHQGIPIEGEIYPIVHRDIKPGNIMVIRDESMGEVVKILDFGIAKILQEDNNQTNSFMGTLAYSSPEQMEGLELDGRSDIYSLGIMMFQMLTSKMPLSVDTHTFGSWYRVHHFQPPRALHSVNSTVEIPKALENLVMRCLAKSPADRPQNTGEILKSLEPLEQRYRKGRELGEQISKVLQDRPINQKPVSPPTLSPEEICKFASWPSNKPIADIVFPNQIRTTKEVLATLWVMLERKEIEKRLVCTRYNQFLFLPSPHPALLWLTVLFNREHGPRWLSCYLDLKTIQGQQMAKLLGQAGQYRLLFFAKEQPQRCAHVLTATIAQPQCNRLQEWVLMAQMSPPSGQFNLSKSQLKAELEKKKPEILVKLASFYGTNSDQ